MANSLYSELFLEEIEVPQDIFSHVKDVEDEHLADILFWVLYNFDVKDMKDDFEAKKFEVIDTILIFTECFGIEVLFELKPYEVLDLTLKDLIERYLILFCS